MRLSITLSIAVLMLIQSIESYADGSKLEQTKPEQTEYKSLYSDLVTNNSLASLLILTQDVTIKSFNNLKPLEDTPKIKGEFNTRLLSIQAGVLQSKQEPSLRKYYFQGAVTLHKYNDFNVSFMANIEQINNFNFHHNQTTVLDSSAPLNATKLNYSYGIITSYSVNSAWQFSGGIIHAEPISESAKTPWYTDANMALIGTTYSF